MTNKTQVFKYVGSVLTALTLVVFTLPVNAQTTPNPVVMDPNQSVNTVLCSMGLGCYSNSNSTSSVVNTNSSSNSSSSSTGSGVSSTSSSSGGIWGFFFGTSSSNKQGIIYGSLIAKAFTANRITLVRVAQSDSVAGVVKPGEQVYEIIQGKKHLIPNLDIFIDYGFKPQQVQFITQEELEKYSRVRLFQVSGDKTKATYYLTDNGGIRRVLSQDVLESYGGRTEDIIMVSKKEFNFYPENIYVYAERPYTGDIYMIDGKAKRYLTPMAVRRLDIQSSQLAPINETEFNTYEIGKPVVF